MLAYESFHSSVPKTQRESPGENPQNIERCNFYFCALHIQHHNAAYRVEAKTRVYVPTRLPRQFISIMVVLDEQEDHPYNAHIQFIDEDSGTLLVFLEELGVKQTVPAKNVQPLPLDITKLGDHPYFPVTSIDFLRFVKKGRRRRQHRVMPIAVVAGQTAASPSPDRGRTISTNSTNSNATSSPSEANSGSPSKSETDLVIYRPDKNDSYHNTSSRSDNVRNSFFNNDIINSNTNCDLVPDNSSHNGATSVPCFTSNLSSEYSGQVTTGYLNSLVLDGAAVSFTEYRDPSAVDKDLSPVEGCPVTLTFSPTCLPQTAAPGRGGYHHSQAHHPLMSSSNSGVAVGGIPANPPPLPPQQQQGGYWMPVVAVPYHQHAPGGVNIAWPQSYDSHGKDLPHSGHHLQQPGEFNRVEIFEVRVLPTKRFV
ncbi:hypothetical protein ElyMa_005704800 [Elysia marginata]|uniref:Uncharacterized protein n=1 Tax=Elysia marginata TaxID=1093978 RepID=A0AAV4FGM8_9GAST|nr:hypothetical protein ElyMa_005704800 [Elysia marginata]